MAKKKIRLETEVNIPKEKAWEIWTDPTHITNWNFASEEWCCPAAENDLREGGRFSYRMEARDGSMGFAFSGKYTELISNEKISYKLDDNREVSVEFIPYDTATKVVETFEAESENSLELQKEGWQAILDNFKKHAESGN